MVRIEVSNPGFWDRLYGRARSPSEPSSSAPQNLGDSKLLSITILIMITITIMRPLDLCADPCNPWFILSSKQGLTPSPATQLPTTNQSSGGGPLLISNTASVGRNFLNQVLCFLMSRRVFCAINSGSSSSSNSPRR